MEHQLLQEIALVIMCKKVYDELGIDVRGVVSAKVTSSLAFDSAV